MSSEVGVGNVKLLGKGWSILVGFDLDEFPDKEMSAVFSHSDNGCFQFVINDIKSKDKDKTFQFRKTGETGNKNTFFTKYSPVASQRYHIAIT